MQANELWTNPFLLMSSTDVHGYLDAGTQNAQNMCKNVSRTEQATTWRKGMAARPWAGPPDPTIGSADPCHGRPTSLPGPLVRGRVGRPLEWSPDLQPCPFDTSSIRWTRKHTSIKIQASNRASNVSNGRKSGLMTSPIQVRGSATNRRLTRRPPDLPPRSADLPSAGFSLPATVNRRLGAMPTVGWRKSVDRRAARPPPRSADLPSGAFYTCTNRRNRQPPLGSKIKPSKFKGGGSEGRPTSVEVGRPP